MGRVTWRALLWTSFLGAASVLAVVVALGAAASPGAPPARVASTTAAAATDPVAPPYPYAIAGRIGPWGFPTRYATDYVAWRLFERDVAFSSDVTGPTGRRGHFGEPGTWAATAAGIGYTVDEAPTVGAIAHWKAGEQGAGRAGHVAYVERVNPDGSVVVSELDRSGDHAYSQRESVRAPRYIHIQN
jgi:surface antigen